MREGIRVVLLFIELYMIREVITEIQLYYFELKKSIFWRSCGADCSGRPLLASCTGGPIKSINSSIQRSAFSTEAILCCCSLKLNIICSLFVFFRVLITRSSCINTSHSFSRSQAQQQRSSVGTGAAADALLFFFLFFLSLLMCISW